MGQEARGGLGAWLGCCVDGGICRRGQGDAAVVPEAVRRHGPAVVSGRADGGGSPEDSRAGEGHSSSLLTILVLVVFVNCIVMMFAFVLLGKTWFQFLVEAGLYEGEEESAKREEVLSEIGQVISCFLFCPPFACCLFTLQELTS